MTLSGVCKLRFPDEFQMPLLGAGATYIVMRGRHASSDQTDLNMWFRLILGGVGGTIQKMGPFGARGANRPHHQDARAGVGPPRRPLRPSGSLILLDASFLGAKSR
jgi:hypothetical protein